MLPLLIERIETQVVSRMSWRIFLFFAQPNASSFRLFKSLGFQEMRTLFTCIYSVLLFINRLAIDACFLAERCTIHGTLDPVF